MLRNEIFEINGILRLDQDARWGLRFSWIDKDGHMFTSSERDSVIERVKQEVVQLYQKGIPVDAIEKLCDVNKRSVYRYLREKGVTANRRK